MKRKPSTDDVLGAGVPRGVVRGVEMPVGRISGQYGKVSGEWPAAFSGCAWTEGEKARLFELLESISRRV